MTLCSRSSTQRRALMSVSRERSCTCQGCCKASSRAFPSSTFTWKTGSEDRSANRSQELTLSSGDEEETKSK